MSEADILTPAADAPAKLEAAAETFARVKAGLGAVIFGQDTVIEQVLVTLLKLRLQTLQFGGGGLGAATGPAATGGPIVASPPLNSRPPSSIKTHIK